MSTYKLIGRSTCPEMSGKDFLRQFTGCVFINALFNTEIVFDAGDDEKVKEVAKSFQEEMKEFSVELLRQERVGDYAFFRISI